MKSRKYQEIHDALASEIQKGVYDADGTLPGENVIAGRFSTARETVRKALAMLAHEGFVTRKMGAGTYVAKRARRRTGEFGLLMPDVSSARIFRDFVTEIRRLARRNGYEVVVDEFMEESAEAAAVRVRRIARGMVVRNVEGVVFRPFVDERLADANMEVVRIFKNAGMPVVLLDADVVESPKRSECDLVAIDNVSAGRRVAEHLIARGYRRIAFLMQGGAFRSNINWRNRFFGVAGESALRGIAEAVTPLYFEPGDIARLRRLCRSRFRPQAIVCGNDETAELLMESLRTLGKRIPHDIAVVGFDDIDIAACTVPALTTVRQPSRDIARAALRTLLGRIARPNDDPREVLVNAPLVVRSST